MKQCHLKEDYLIAVLVLILNLKKYYVDAEMK